MNLYVCVCPECYHDITRPWHDEPAVQLVAASTPGRAKGIAHRFQSGLDYCGEYVDWRVALVDQQIAEAKGLLTVWPERYEEGLGPKLEAWINRHLGQ